jgi:hypothetical protein
VNAELARITHFLHSRFFVRLGIPFLRPDPHVLEAGAQGLSRSAVALAWPHAPSFSRPRLDSPEHGGTLVVVGMTIRGELAIGR